MGKETGVSLVKVLNFVYVYNSFTQHVRYLGMSGDSAVREACEAVIETIQMINKEIDLVVVYQEEVIAIRSVLTSYSSLLRSHMKSIPEEMTTTLADFQSNLKTLAETIKMVTKDYWIQVALDWSVQRVPNELNRHMIEIYHIMSSLKIGSPQKYVLKPSQISKDYQTIYAVFAKGSKTNAKVQQRLKSVIKCLHDNNIPMPKAEDNTHASDLAAIFDQIREFQVRHEDFKIDRQIGFGASGQVFLAHQLSNNRKVAIKQLNSTKLNDSEVESLRREIVVLSSLKHPYLIEFLGATKTPPYWILTEYMPGKSLFHRLRDKNGLTGTQKTIIAYEIAEGMAYLHSKNVIHRDLKSLNVLLDSNNEPRVCDFGISREVDAELAMTGLIGTFNYMAPEVIKRTRYNQKADVFSFAMLLWEMVKREIPYHEFDMDQMKIAMAIVEGVRPDIPSTVLDPLKKLMEDCWTANPESRPSFQAILQRMRKEKVVFAGANEAEIKQFYDSKNPDSPRSGDVKKVMKLIESPSSELIKVLQKVNNSADAIAQLRHNGFVAKATPLLLKIENSVILAYTLICVMDSASLVNDFLGAGGIKAICGLLKLKNESSVKYANALINHCINSIQADDAKLLVKALFEAEQWDSATNLIQTFRLDVRDLAKGYLDKILAASEENDNCAILVSYIGNLEEIPLAKMTPRLAIMSQSKDLVDKLLKNEKFTAHLDDACVMQVVSTVTNSQTDNDAKVCALKLASAFGPSLSVQLANEKEFILTLMQFHDLPVACTVLNAISRFQNGATVMLHNVNFLEAQIKKECVLSLFAGLGHFFQSECLKFSWLMDTIEHNIGDLEQISTSLKVLVALAESPEFVNHKHLMKMLMRLIRSAECTVPEMKLLVTIFWKISANCSLIDVYGYLLQAAESKCCYSGQALRAIAHQKLPAPNTRYSTRLMDILSEFLATNDELCNTAGGEMLQKMSRRRTYVKLVVEAGFEEKLNRALMNTDNIQVYALLLEVLKDYHMKLTNDARAVGEQMLLESMVEDTDAMERIRATLKCFE